MIDIRKAAEEDLPQVRTVLVDTWHATYDSIFGAVQVDEIANSWHALANLRKELNSGRTCRLVATLDARVIATACASRREPQIVKLHQLYILPEFQSRGLGKRLLACMLSQFPDASRVSLEVEPQNARAIAFYTQCGFVQIGNATDCGVPGAGIPALVFERRV